MRDLSDPYEADRRQQADVRRQKASTMLQNSSITQGGLRVASANGILAQSVAGGNPAVRVTGLQVVDGVLRVTGTLEGGGTWSWSGTLTQTGTTNLNGPWNLNGVGTIAGNVTATGTLTQNGPWNLVGLGTITGDVTQTGNTTQQGNVTLTGGGKITAGNVRVEPNKVIVGGADGDTTLLDSRMTFSNGSALRADSAGVQIVQGNAQCAAFAGQARLRAGVRTFSVSDTGGYTMTSLPTKTAASTGLPAGVLHADASGGIFRIVT